MFEVSMRLLLTLLFLLVYKTVFSQTNYGNDWINYNQQYYKIKVTQKGIHRLNHQTLNQQIPNLNTINPKSLQLFKNGKEIAIYVQGESDNSFDASDFIEFYSEPNDGTLDKDLYVNATDQPHAYYSLFTDTAAYFLTFSANTSGQRIQNFKAVNTGLTAEPFIIYESLGIFPENYYQGRYIVAEMSLSEYIEGEGFLGNVYSKGAQQNRVLATPNLYTGSASAIKFETYVAGRSNARSTDVQGNNHHLRISINNGSNTVIKKDTLFKAYAVAKTTFTLASNELGTNTNIIYNSVDDLGALTDFQAVAYTKITYPRTTNLQGVNVLNFTLPANPLDRYLNFINSSLTKPVLWDLTTNSRVVANINSTNAEFILPTNNAARNIFLYDSTSYISAAIDKVNFLNINPVGFDKDFLIVTHQSLLNGAQNYATYRQQTGYKPYVITTDQLYDQFYYGVHHPLAIRNFYKYLLQFAATKPQYLLLLGKGLENSLLRNSSGLNTDLVPTYGSPPADDLFTAHLNGANFEAGIPTGRIVAHTNDDVEQYLQKLKTFEQLPDSLWRKKLIHISGGNVLSENISWSGYQKNFFNNAKGEFFGADTVNFQKFVNQPVTANLKQKIINQINNGAAMLSFFGHGSAQATEIDFGNPNELNNKSKPLIFLINGCTTGNPFIAQPSLSEKHILYPDKGAVGWLGTSSEGIASYLANYSEIFYRKAFNQNYAEPIAKAIKEAKRQYQNTNDLINLMHLTQYTWQGDPALKFYSPAKPDYQIEDKDLFIYPNNVTAVSDSFAVAIVVKNIGKALTQPLKVSVSRVLPDNSIVSYPVQTFTKSVYHTDTLYYYIKSNDVKTAGINHFTVTLDPQNDYSELNEMNNVASFQYNMVVNGMNTLYPKQFAIIPQTNVELVAQSNNLLIGNADYIFEIDTVNTFNSPWKKTSGILNAGFMPKWRPTLLPDDKKVYYWRVKLNLDPDKGGIWQESSFTYINGSADGWNQSHTQQYQNTSLANIEFNPSNQLFEFKKSAFITSIQTRGDDAPTTDERTYRSNPGGRLGYIGFEFVGITVLALKPNTFKTFNYPSAYNVVNDDGQGPYYSGQYYFNINDPVAVDSLIGYLNQIPQGYYVIGFNGRGINLSALPQAAKNAFSQVGLINIGNISAGEPYMFWGEKGLAPGMAIEKMADAASSIPARSQQIKFGKEYPFPFNQGSYVTQKTGPANQWKKAYYSLKKETSDQVTFDLIGYDKSGNAQTLLTNLPADSVDISSYDAQIFPKMAIKANIVDNTDRTPPQIINWKFLYDEIGENTINPELKNDFYKGLVQEGDSIKWELALQNISKYPSDSAHVFYTLTKPDRSVIKQKAGKIEVLQPNTSTTFKLKLPTMGLTGNNLLKFDFVPINEKDTYLFNNYLQQAFTVSKDDKEPLVDVAFDGKHIMNGEIVSPLPNIFINLIDENSFLLLKDTTVLDISLKTANGNFQRISYSGGQLNFTPATTANNNKASVFYKPNRLADGIYTLMVEAKDASGNVNPNNNYTINFEVINESTITHFYPYPNPFTTAMKFVFTITGDKIPDKIKVQIMTITGKIVREIFKEELGAIKIGNNISDFTWDGTDQYGDRLANGVYFYKVIVENSDKSEIKHRNTKADSYFKHNTGKIYLMR